MSEVRAKYDVPEVPAIPEGDRLHLLYVPLSWARQKFLKENFKRHDLGALHELIREYNYRDPMQYDGAANDGAGGLVAGNGRLETLCQMFDGGMDAPGKIVAVDGDWLVPMIFGADSRTAQEAIRYAIDHNVAPLKGGDFSPYDMLSKMFDEGVYDVLREQFEAGTPTIALDGDDLDSALTALEVIDNQMLDFDDDGEEDITAKVQGNSNQYAIAVVLDREDWEDWNSYKEMVGLKNDKAALLRLLRDS